MKDEKEKEDGVLEENQQEKEEDKEGMDLRRKGSLDMLNYKLRKHK